MTLAVRRRWRNDNNNDNRGGNKVQQNMSDRELFSARNISGWSRLQHRKIPHSIPNPSYRREWPWLSWTITYHWEVFVHEYTHIWKIIFRASCNYWATCFISLQQIQIHSRWRKEPVWSALLLLSCCYQVHLYVCWVLGFNRGLAVEKIQWQEALCLTRPTMLFMLPARRTDPFWEFIMKLEVVDSEF